MKSFSGVIVFAVVFLFTGAAVHYGFYRTPGVFIWSLSSDPETEAGFFARTRLDLVASAQAAELNRESYEDDERTPSAPEENEPRETEAASEVDSAESVAAEERSEIPLFNGEDLSGWEKTRFGGEGDVFVNEEGHLEFGFGAVITGVHWVGDPPGTSQYEIELEAMKLDGHDFFCALTFPVADSHATFVVGGWGGGVVGISCVDDLSASENETMSIEGFERDRWFRIKVRVTDEKLEAWIDDRRMVDLELEGRKISLLPGDIELSKPLGIASYQTRAQYRNFVWRPLAAEQ